MPKLVGEGHHIARFAKIVQHHIGMHVCNGGMGEGPGGFARLHPGINPAIIKERFRDFGHAGVKAGIGIHDRGACVSPRDGAVIFHRQGGVAIPHFHCVQPKPFALQFVIPVRQTGIGFDNGIAQGFDHLGFYMV